MKVKIDDNLYLESDEHQYIIRKYLGTYSTHNKGKENEYERENFRTIGYYASINQALTALIESEIKTSTAKDLKGLKNDVKEISKWFKDKLGGY